MRPVSLNAVLVLLGLRIWQALLQGCVKGACTLVGNTLVQRAEPGEQGIPQTSRTGGNGGGATCLISAFVCVWAQWGTLMMGSVTRGLGTYDSHIRFE
ncbi:hypothetical protein EVAR_41151_1 [Eumeta japonica]|uniref:Secreted protein n=1 Tax=Eumeta variegata TaxID=151549 RepID=A0A4C1YF11_EUMVA|nr:hypothetical protein EVAR_41151_1 [Eumeta japonica]